MTVRVVIGNGESDDWSREVADALTRFLHARIAEQAADTEAMLAAAMVLSDPDKVSRIALIDQLGTTRPAVASLLGPEFNPEDPRWP